MSRRGNSRSNQNQIDTFGRGGDPFKEMHQVMKSFGGFGGFGGMDDDDFFGRGRRDPFEEMM